MTPYQEFKKKLGNTRPWDDIRPLVKTVSDEASAARYGICEQCPQFIGLSQQCKDDGALLRVKITLQDAKCPLGKW